VIQIDGEDWRVADLVTEPGDERETIIFEPVT
jgi:hypothetical protein